MSTSMQDTTSDTQQTAPQAAAQATPGEAAGEAPKKATTRKRSTASTSEAKEAEKAESTQEAAQEAPKKATTRKRNTASASKAKAAAEAQDASEAGEAPKKATTRKRSSSTASKAKPADKAEGAQEAADATAADKPATRKRATKAAPAEQAAEAPAQPADADGQAQAKPAAKKTTRRRSTKAAAPEKAADEQAASKEAAPAEAPKAEAAAPAEAAKAEAPEAAPAEEAAGAAEGKPAEGGTGEGEAKPAEDAAEQGGEGRSKSGKRRRNRRNRNNKQRREIVPSATRDELSALEDEELSAKAEQLSVDASEYGERDDLVSAVYDALLQSEGFVQVEGILDLLPDGYGFIRTDGYLPGEHDVYVGMSLVRRNGLRKGDYITGRVRPPRDNEKYPALNTIMTLNDEPFEGPQKRAKFANLTPIYPDERLVMEHGKDTITARAIDLVSPIGKGQRGLIVSPPKAGKTTVLKDIAAAISANNPEVHLMCLLVDERPEEVTDMERSIDGEVISSTFDMPCENHIAVAELVIERAKRLVENGQDVVILLDSITRLARAYNLNQPASGRILSGGVDSTALYPPKKFLGAARNIEFGGSLTILGTALIDTGSKMDEVIFEEFKGTGNMELKLDRQLADKRVFPAIDPVSSSTRKDELLIDPQEAPLVWGLRRLLANMNNTERAMKMLIQSLKQTETNREFLVKSARKAAGQ